VFVVAALLTGRWLLTLVLALWVVVAALLALVLGLGRRVRDLEGNRAGGTMVVTRPEISTLGPVVGSRVDFPGASPPGIVGTEARDRLVLFLNSSCGPCHLLGDEVIAARDDGFIFDSDLVLVTDELGASFYGGLRASTVVVEPSSELSRALGIHATPYGLAVDATGIVKWSGVVGNFDDVLSMAVAVGLDAGWSG
jgi:hypothetical protein